MSSKIYCINHRFREEMILPICAIAGNIRFLLTQNTRYVETTDKVKCEVLEFSTANICALEEKVLSLYRIPAWDFLKTWYKTYPNNLYSVEFVVLKLKKCDE